MIKQFIKGILGTFEPQTQDIKDAIKTCRKTRGISQTKLNSFKENIKNINIEHSSYTILSKYTGLDKRTIKRYLSELGIDPKFVSARNPDFSKVFKTKIAHVLYVVDRMKETGFPISVKTVSERTQYSKSMVSSIMSKKHVQALSITGYKKRAVFEEFDKISKTVSIDSITENVLKDVCDKTNTNMWNVKRYLKMYINQKVKADTKG